jgi:hypothetical protein
MWKRRGEWPLSTPPFNPSALRVGLCSASYRLPMFAGPLEDRLLIRERMNTYADAIFQGDAEAWLANYIDDGVWRVAGAEHRGKPALRLQWEQMRAPIKRMTFFTEVGAIEAQDDRATARCYCREILLLKSGGVRKIVGQYDDQLVRQAGVWLFARRDYRLFLDEDKGKPL